MSAPSRSAWAVGALLFGVGVCVSYAVQHLLAKALVSAGAGAVVAQVHVPFTWRLFLSALHGVLLALISAISLSEARARAVLHAGPWIVAVVIVPFAVCMVVFP